MDGKFKCLSNKLMTYFNESNYYCAIQRWYNNYYIQIKLLQTFKKTVAQIKKQKKLECNADHRTWSHRTAL